VTLDDLMCAARRLAVGPPQSADRPAGNETVPSSSLTIEVGQAPRAFFKMDIASLQVDGNQYHLVVFTDITDIKETELRKGEMVSVVSHELKQPLTAIMGFSELITLTSEGKQKDYASLINREGQRMSRFINAFLNITRLESGKQEPVKTPTDLPELISGAVDAMTPLASAKQISLFLKVPETVRQVVTDGDLLKQCVMNLVENGIKYSPPGANVTVRIRDTGDCLSIMVQDNGYGIRREDQERLFEKFFRGQPTGPTIMEGSGLGLAFVKEAVQALGGSITVESEEGRGTTFTILLP
jgi:two-component system, OmpR family, phosphate regulon sensor histidine kinase PhoR